MAKISDVAQLAGVSPQTVSRTINYPDLVRPETRATVEAAIRQLNYHPNNAARTLATRRSKTIGLISTGVAAHTISKRMRAVDEAARSAGYQVSIANLDSADRGQLLAALDVLLRQQIEGLVLIAADQDALEAIHSIELDVPLVTAESSGRPDLHSVSIDQFLGARLAVRHLVDLGHREILHLSGPLRHLDAVERLRGWRAELETHGLAVREPLIGDWRADSGYTAGIQLADSLDCTAVFAGSDEMALGLLHAFRDRGIRVPEDLSVVGFDDLPGAAHFLPPLTTVRQDFDELARGVIATLLAMMDGTEVATPLHTEPELVVRESTRPLSLAPS
ncbi:LacI family DNA-binding transcriptional regulator [Rugosimonospora acidiphila]|uniref:LacI family DNA-binding transcriptional regulator n=1 Tax=Rugosimonospora acidiphila TaxID=556531 RepID=A0ABP9SCV8_9ACTN